LKIIWLAYQNNYLKRVNDTAVKSFNILTINLKISHNYFDGPNKIIVRSLSIKIFKYFSKIFWCNSVWFFVILVFC